MLYIYIYIIYIYIYVRIYVFPCTLECIYPGENRKLKVLQITSKIIKTKK